MDQELEGPGFECVKICLPFLMLGWSLYPKEWSGKECDYLIKPRSDEVVRKRAIDIKEHLIGLIKRNQLSLHFCIDGKWVLYEEVKNRLILQKMNVIESLVEDYTGDSICCVVPEEGLIDKIQDYLDGLVRDTRGRKREYLMFDMYIFKYFYRYGNFKAERAEVINYLNKQGLPNSETPGTTTYNERIEQMRHIFTNLIQDQEVRQNEMEGLERMLKHLKSLSKKRLDK